MRAAKAKLVIWENIWGNHQVLLDTQNELLVAKSLGLYPSEKVAIKVCKKYIKEHKDLDIKKIITTKGVVKWEK